MTSMEVKNSSSSRLETFYKSMGSMPYMGFRINVYKVKSDVPSNQDAQRYVYMPAVLLDHCSAESRWNQVSRQAELLFTVQMWDEELEAKVFEYVTRRDTTVQHHQIQVIPFESVIVASSAPSMQSSGWMSYHGIEKELHVVMVCPSMDDANRLINVMKMNPRQFLSVLKVKFSLERQKVLRKETFISIEHVRDGKLFCQVLERFPDAETALLTSDGVERLISESLTKVVANSFDDNEVVTKDSIIYSKLKEVIVDSQVTINEQSKGLWELVFWDKDNYRPDRAAKIMTEVYNQSDDQSRRKLSDIFIGTSNNSVDVDRILEEFGKQTSKTNNSYHAQPREELAKVLKSSKNYLEWTGEKFQPKPMSFIRVHLAKFINRRKFQDVQVSVSYSLAAMTTDLHIFPKGCCCSSQTKQLAEQVKLNESLKLAVQKQEEAKKQMELIETFKLNTTKQFDEMKGKLAQQMELNNSFKLTLQKLNDEAKAKFAKQTELIDSLKSTMQKQSDEYKDKFSKQIELNNSLKLLLQKQNDEWKTKSMKQTELHGCLESTIEKQAAEIVKNKESLAKLSANMSWGISGFLWRIDNVAARMAKSEILYSDEFYTWQYGYKLKARVDFNGNGDGKGTHLSVFFKVVPGEYDGLLEWPFPLSVTLTLYNQVTDPSQADNFTLKARVDEIPLHDRHPTTETYWGYHEFLSHEMLLSHQFIKDDVMYLKISFDLLES